ncbi:hypothetical protein QR680_011543 [Steinernema hermaphroditum]|uniref:Uncharacterized protein n=1 Tax=Steinernema hermaphroditum TaxID=289476 RepID=A0AA39LYW0_9BILA|nr:hypothetical protein QR680_011543 [Steinernema hermaphroditum]
MDDVPVIFTDSVVGHIWKNFFCIYKFSKLDSPIWRESFRKFNKNEHSYDFTFAIDASHQWNYRIYSLHDQEEQLLKDVPKVLMKHRRISHLIFDMAAFTTAQTLQRMHRTNIKVATFLVDHLAHQACIPHLVAKENGSYFISEFLSILHRRSYISNLKLSIYHSTVAPMVEDFVLDQIDNHRLQVLKLEGDFSERVAKALPRLLLQQRLQYLHFFANTMTLDLLQEIIDNWIAFGRPANLNMSLSYAFDKMDILKILDLENEPNSYGHFVATKNRESGEVVTAMVAHSIHLSFRKQFRGLPSLLSM